jgi:hypothetical protein
MGCLPRERIVACLGVCVLLVLAASLVAFRRSPQARLEGRWLGHRFESLDGSVGAGRAGWAKGTSLTFSGSRISVQVPGEPARQGAYEVLRERDGELELAITGHDGHIDHAELTLETDELLRWHLTPVHTLVMHHD